MKLEHVPFISFVGAVCLAVSAFSLPVDGTKYGHLPSQEATSLESFTESALGDNYVQQMDPEALAAFRDMQAAAAADGIRVQSQSAYRSDAQQAQLFQDAVERYGSEEAAARWVAPPGHSEHSTGKAVDLLGSNGLLTDTGVDGVTFDWLQSNASDFGFILSYPEGNDKGVGFEPWHWFYVGREETTPVKDEEHDETNETAAGKTAEEAAEDLFGAILGEAVNQLASGLPIDYFVRMDLPLGQSSCAPEKSGCEEQGIDNTASGNWKNRSIPCKKSEVCSHVEVWRPSRSDHRIRWISGRDQKVSGGWGVGRAICSKEPTGRYPFNNSLIKLVLTGINEEQGSANFAFYLAQEIRGPFGIKIGETAACFGPFPVPPPFNTVKEGEWALFGMDKLGVDLLGISKKELRGLVRTNAGSRTRKPSDEEVLAKAEDCEGSTGTYKNPTTGVFTSGYGWRWGRMHHGVDIANSIGTPIYAANCGVVDFVAYQGGFGNVLTIQHPSGANTLYAHLDQVPLPARGETVQRGQLIGYMGTTGRSTGPHLHFEIHPYGYGQSANPQNYGIP